MECLLFLLHFSGAHKKREAAAPKPSDCISGGAQEIFGGVSKDFLGGDGKAEGAKVPGAGIWIEAVPRKSERQKKAGYRTGKISAVSAELYEQIRRNRK
jgi:hypothetical protein